MKGVEQIEWGQHMEIMETKTKWEGISNIPGPKGERALADVP